MNTEMTIQEWAREAREEYENILEEGISTEEIKRLLSTYPEGESWKESDTVREKLVKAQDEYIKFLEKYTSDIATYLHIHQMSPKREQVEKAKQLREEIRIARAAELDKEGK